MHTFVHMLMCTQHAVWWHRSEDPESPSSKCSNNVAVWYTRLLLHI